MGGIGGGYGDGGETGDLFHVEYRGERSYSSGTTVDTYGPGVY